MEFDEKLESLRRMGCIVPSHKIIKTPEQIEGIRQSAQINIAVLDYVAQHIQEGVTTEEIDRWVYEQTVNAGAIPAPLNYEGFPKSVCTSINEQVCHGIPSPDDVLKDGDIINVDVSTIYNGYFSDSSRMFCIGNVSEEKKKLVEVTRECVQLGLEQVKPWGFLGIWPRRSMIMPGQTATPLSGRSAAMAAAWNSTKIPGWVILESAARRWSWLPVWSLP